MKANLRYLAVATTVAFFVFGSAQPAAAQEQHSGHAQGVGEVDFKVGCNAAAQAEFNLAMAHYHSFAWSNVELALDKVLQADPGCAMAHWARALASLDNPFVWPVNLSAQVLTDAAAALAQARKTGVSSPRELAYVDALEVFFDERDKLDHPTRAKALEQALAEVALRFPDDQEAAILHALVLSANFDPADKAFTNQLKAGEILEPIFAAQPGHPGVAHYLIHSYDYPPIAHRGLDAARHYSKIAPAAAHALHMPSHIFTRVGDWRESIASNRASADSASANAFNKLHAFDYMVYAHMQLAQDQAARRVVEQARETQLVDNFAFAYAWAAMPARLALERGAWKEAANLELFPAPATYPWNKYPQAEAVNAFSRGIGAAMNQDPGAAQAEFRRLQALRDAMAAKKSPYWVEQIDIQAEVVRGLAVGAEGDREAGIAILRKAADREDATEKHVVTPGPIVPAREVLAQTLLATGKPGDALREFEVVMKCEPNRYRTFAGAARAAESAGDVTKTREYHARLLALTAQADTAREEPAQAGRNKGK